MLGRLFLFSLFYSAAGALAGDPTTFPRFVEEEFRVDGLADVGIGGMVSLDLDGDGRVELITGARTATIPAHPLLVTFAQTDDNLRIQRAQIVRYDDEIVRILKWMPNDVPHILTVSFAGLVRDYTGLPLAESRQFATAGPALSAAIGDVDADGDDELLLLTRDTIYRYDLAMGSLEHSHPVNWVSDVALAQLDADPALEIILSGDAPIVLDGATYAIEWAAPQVYSNRVAAGRFGPGGTQQWVTESWNSFSLFGSAPWAPRWSANVDGEIGTVGSVSHDEDRDWIVIGSSVGLEVYDGVDESLRFQVPVFGIPIRASASGDVDGDGTSEIAFSLLETHWNSPDVFVVDGADGSIRSELAINSAPYLMTAVGDVDGDGRVEIVAATIGYAGTLEVFDLATGQPRWRRAYTELTNGNPFGPAIAMALASRSGQPGKDIVIAGARVLTVDGATGTARLMTTPSFPDYLQDLAITDYDEDGIDDFVLAANGSASVIRVLSGVDGALLWTSVEMEDVFSPTRQVLMTGGDSAQPDRQIVALMSGSFRFYDERTGLLDWVLPTSSDSDSGTYVPRGSSGPEVAVFKRDGTVVFHSLRTRLPVRQYELPAPLRELHSLDGTLNHMIAAADDELFLIDGVTGTISARSGKLSPFAESTVRLASERTAKGVWQITVGTALGLYRHRVELGDVIFADGLDGS